MSVKYKYLKKLKNIILAIRNDSCVHNTYKLIHGIMDDKITCIYMTTLNFDKIRLCLVQRLRKSASHAGGTGFEARSGSGKSSLIESVNVL